jgi:hypothetical protein
MWPNSLRLASSERVEGKAGGQPARPDSDQSPEYGKSTAGCIEETSGTHTPNQSIAEVVEKTPTPGEHAPDRFYQHVLIARPVQSAHHEEKLETPFVQPIDSAGTSHHQPEDPPNAGDRRH